jgi:hypothetical protein
MIGSGKTLSSTAMSHINPRPVEACSKASKAEPRPNTLSPYLDGFSVHGHKLSIIRDGPEILVSGSPGLSGRGYPTSLRTSSATSYPRPGSPSTAAATAAHSGLKCRLGFSR